MIAEVGKVTKVNRERAGDCPSSEAVGNNNLEEILKRLRESGRVHPGMTGQIDVSLEERHDGCMQSHLDCGWVKEVAPGAVELVWCKAELMDPLVDAANPGPLGKRGWANADGVSLLCDPRRNTVAAVFVGDMPARTTKKLPFLEKARNGGEAAADFGFNLIDRNHVPVFFFEKEVAGTKLVC